MKLGELFSEDSVKAVIEEMLLRSAHSGPDGIEVEELKEYIEKNDVINTILSGSYKPCPAVLTGMHTNSGKIRKIYSMSNVDRFILKTLNRGIRDFIYEKLSDNCISYRRGFGVSDCCTFIKRALEEGCLFTVRLDIEDYFDNISISRILQMIKPVIEDMGVYNLIETMLFQLSIITKSNIRIMVWYREAH